MRTHDHEVKARLVAAQDLMMNEVLQFQDWGVSSTIVRAASGVDDDCKGRGRVKLDVDEREL